MKAKNTLILLIITTVQSQSLYDQEFYTLGLNLIINPEFSSPHVTDGTTGQIIAGSIPGWTCNNACEIIIFMEGCSVQGVACTPKWRQVIEMDLNGFVEPTQTITLPEDGQYLIHL